MPAWDFEQYTQTLIAKASDFVPTPSQVQEFFVFLAAKNIVPKNRAITLSILTGRLREFPHLPPEIRAELYVEEMQRKSLPDIAEIQTNIAPLADFLLDFAGTGRPETPPLSIDTRAPYHLGVTCRVHSQCRSTSDEHTHDLNTPTKTIPYGRPCPESQVDGIFCNPHNGQTLTIVNAGRARFWIEFKLGKFLCPDFTRGNLQLLNPIIQIEAEKIFGIRFVQGCRW